MSDTRSRKVSLATVGALTVAALFVGTAPAPANAAPSGRAHSATTKDWTVTVWVSRTAVKAGTSIPATVTVDNRSGHPIAIEGCPGIDYEMVAGNSTVPNSPVIPSVACSSTMSPGVHVFHTKVETIYMGCGGGDGSPPCGRPPGLLPLPAGTYQTQIVLPGARPSVPTPRPLTITLTSPARLSVPTSRARSCLETKILTAGSTSLRYPSCWTRRSYVEESMMSNVIAFLSNQPTHRPCTTTHSGTDTTVRCGYPVTALKNGGVLVMFINGGMPGWSIAKATGERLVVDHRVTRETVTHHPPGSIHATEEVSIYIEAATSDNYYELTAFFRGPGVADDQRLLENMLKSMKFQ